MTYFLKESYMGKLLDGIDCAANWIGDLARGWTFGFRENYKSEEVERKEIMNLVLELRLRNEKIMDVVNQGIAGTENRRSYRIHEIIDERAATWPVWSEESAISR